MPEQKNKFFREDDEGKVIVKSAGVLKPVIVKIPFLRPTVSCSDIFHEHTNHQTGIRRHDEVDFNLEYVNGSSLSFFPIGKTIISYDEEIQKGEWLEPQVDRTESYWGGYGLSYVYIAIPCAIFDWLQDNITEQLSSSDASVYLDEDDCEDLFENAELDRDQTHVWIYAEVTDKIRGTTKDEYKSVSSVTHSMFMNKKSAMGRGTIEIQLQRIYENDAYYLKSTYDWHLLFKIDRLDSFEFVDTRFENDE